MRRIHWLVVMLIALALSSVYAADEKAPYLYYYSSVLRAFVVERADGTDSRTLGQSLIAPDARWIQVIGWSPSGEWLAWIENQSILKAISSDGHRYHQFLAGSHNLSGIWSSVEDLLFATQGRAYEDEFEDKDTKFSLIDVPNENVVTQFAIRINESNSMTGAAWSSDGQFIGFYYQNYNEDLAVQKFQSTFVLVNRDGTVTRHPNYWPLPSLNYVGMGLMEWTPQGWIAHFDAESQGLILMNPGQDEQFEVDSPIDDKPHTFYYSFFIWRPQGDYVLIYSANPYSQEEGSTYDLWLLSIPERKFERIASKIYGAAYYPSSTIDPFNGIDGQSLTASWSPDGRYAVFRTSSEDDFALLDLQTDKVEPVPVTLSPDDFGQFNPGVRWSPDSNALLLQNLAPQTSIAIYNIETGGISEIEKRYLSELIFSPHGRYLTIFGQRGSVVDRYTDVSYALSVHSAHVYRVVEYIWSPDEAWLVTVDHLCIAGGCPAILRYAVTNPQGSYWRELEDWTVNWLPEQVDESKLLAGSAESVLLEPERIDRGVEFLYGSEDQTLRAGCDPADEKALLIQERATDRVLYRLHNTQACYGAGGSVYIGVSPDGKLLALGSRYEDSYATLWDIKTGKLLTRFNCTCFEMRFNEDGTKLFTRASSAMLTWDVARLLEQAATS